MKKSDLTVKTTVTQEEFNRFIRFNRYFRVQWQVPMILLLEVYSIYQLIGHLTGASPLGAFGSIWSGFTVCLWSSSLPPTSGGFAVPAPTRALLPEKPAPFRWTGPA